MTKQIVTWRQVVAGVSKTAPKGTGLKGILPLAKKEWSLIKAGKHATKMAAQKFNSATTSKKPKKKSRSRSSNKTAKRKRKRKNNKQ